jgi:hypothetical protein
MPNDALCENCRVRRTTGSGCRTSDGAIPIKVSMFLPRQLNVEHFFLKSLTGDFQGSRDFDNRSHSMVRRNIRYPGFFLDSR